MLDGEPCGVEFLCENKLMNSIIDRFGKKIKTSIIDEDHLVARVTVDLTNTFYAWVFASGGAMRILGPAKSVDEMMKIVQIYQ